MTGTLLRKTERTIRTGKEPGFKERRKSRTKPVSLLPSQFLKDALAAMSPTNGPI